jgi:FkbM family methyltransferase
MHAAEKCLLAAAFAGCLFLIGQGSVDAYARYTHSDCSLAGTFGPDHTTALFARQVEVAKAVRRLAADGPLELWDTPHGRFWRPPTDLRLFTWFIAEQKHDIYHAGTLIHPGDVVLDIGADIGLFVCTALNRGASKVIAVEPHPLKCEAMRRTYEAEIATGKVIVYPKGVWDKDEVLKLDGITINDRFGTDVPLTTIDNLATELKLDRLDVVKMDIEGAEPKAIQGGRQTIMRFLPAFTIATEQYPDDYITIPALLRSIAEYRETGQMCAAQFKRLQPYTMTFAARQ